MDSNAEVAVAGGEGEARHLGWRAVQWITTAFALATAAGSVVLLWEPGSTAFGLSSVALFSLGATTFAVALAIAIYRRQAHQANLDKIKHEELLARIAGSASSAADNSDYARANTDLILSHLEAAQQAKTGSPISASERVDVERALSDQNPYNRRVLLWVDDHKDWIADERDAFEEAGVTVVWAPTTTAALAVLDGNEFDAVITDMGREEGRWEGYVLLDAMRSRGDTTPVFVYTFPESKGQDVYEHGGQGVVVSPVSSSRL